MRLELLALHINSTLAAHLLILSQVVLQEVYSATCSQDVDNGVAEDVMAVLLKVDTRKPLRGSALETVKTKLASCIRKHHTQVGSIELNTDECLQRVRTKGRKAFGNNIEDKVVLASLKGLQAAVSGKMRYLNGDTFFNRWPAPVTPVAVLPRETELTAERLFDLGKEVSVEETDNGEETLEPTSLEVADGQVIPFPHEHHYLLTQEMLYVFHSDVLIDTTPGSGARLLAALLSNIRAPLKSLSSWH